ncbi:MAG: carboxypeptidase-like regulatory domain-containing protein [Pyrinomonadaceae bacterium]
MRRKYDNLLKTNLSKISFIGKNIGRLLLVCGLMLGFSIVGKAVTLSQTTNQTTILDNNSISCNLDGEHANNSYWRAFMPSTFGQTGTFTVTGVRIGVEEATAGSGGNQPITIRIYTNSGGAFPGGTRTLIGTTNTTVANGALFFQDIAVTAPIQPVTTEIVVEVFTPDGQTVGNRFFIGSNNLGQSAPSYISAASCGAPNPTNVASAGAPNMHTLIALVGNNIPTAASTSVLGRVVTADGRGIRNARISITLPNGEVRTALSGSFGYYRFDDLEVGQTYILSIAAKRYTFINPTRIISLKDELAGEDFIGE